MVYVDEHANGKRLCEDLIAGLKSVRGNKMPRALASIRIAHAVSAFLHYFENLNCGNLANIFPERWIAGLAFLFAKADDRG